MLVFFRVIGLFICLGYVPTLVALEEDDDAPTSQASSAGPTAGNDDVLALPDESLRLSGIRTQVLQAIKRQNEFSALGSVVSLEPLLALRQQYLSASSLQDGARARYQESSNNLNRTRELHSQDIISTRRLQEQQAVWQSEKANLANSGHQQQGLIASSTWQWGPTLTEWFVQGQTTNAEPFLNHRAQLLLITLPTQIPSNADIRIAFVDERGRRAQAHRAERIARAPQVDPITQGIRYFFKLEGQHLPIGSQLTAWISDDAIPQNGVILPNSAIIWHLGQACVFVKRDHGHFERKVLQEFTPSEGGYFVAHTLQTGDEVVVTGAQTLLSQELKHQIPSENDD